MIRSSTVDQGVATLSLAGSRLDAANAAEFKEALARTIDEGQTRIVLDMAGIAFIDSSGLGALVGILKRLGSRGDLALAAVQPGVQKALTLTRMDRVFQIFPDTGSAATKLRG